MRSQANRPGRLRKRPSAIGRGASSAAQSASEVGVDLRPLDPEDATLVLAFRADRTGQPFQVRLGRARAFVVGLAGDQHAARREDAQSARQQGAGQLALARQQQQHLHMRRVGDGRHGTRCRPAAAHRPRVESPVRSASSAPAAARPCRLGRRRNSTCVRESQHAALERKHQRLQGRIGAGRNRGGQDASCAGTGRDLTASACRRPAARTRQITLPTSSATSKAPARSIATPTGRPRALPLASRKPVSTSCTAPAGRPLAKGTKTTR